jgi:hypothetical protein
MSIVPVGSNTERSHKRYDHHHIKTRNRLGVTFVDGIVRAKLSIASERRGQSNQSINSRDVNPQTIEKYLEAFNAVQQDEEALFQSIRLPQTSIEEEASEERRNQDAKAGCDQEEMSTNDIRESTPIELNPDGNVREPSEL